MTSAVSGIAIARPSVGNDVVPISVVGVLRLSREAGPLTRSLQAFLVALFLVQFRGTARLAYVFAPGTPSMLSNVFSSRTDANEVTLIWLSLLGATGIVNIIRHPGIFRALDPSRAIMRTACTLNYEFAEPIIQYSFRAHPGL